MNDDGTTELHGYRRQSSFASPTYCAFASRVVAALTTRNGHDPCVLCRQIDNEIGVPT